MNAFVSNSLTIFRLSMRLSFCSLLVTHESSFLKSFFFLAVVKSDLAVHKLGFYSNIGIHLLRSKNCLHNN